MVFCLAKYAGCFAVTPFIAQTSKQCMHMMQPQPQAEAEASESMNDGTSNHSSQSSHHSVMH